MYMFLVPLRGLYTCDKYFCDVLFAFLHTVLSEKGSTVKGKSLLPFSGDPVLRREANRLTELPALKVYTVPLTLLLMQVFANSIDPDETAHNEPSHLDLRCLTFTRDVRNESLISIWRLQISS